MPDLPPTADLETHDVRNQPDFPPRDPWAGDIALRDQVALAGGYPGRLVSFGAALADPSIRAAAEAARAHPPALRLFDRQGRRCDEVVFDAGYHRMMELGVHAGYSALPWQDGVTGGHVAHAAMVYMLTQVEPGICCPLTMTYAGFPALEAAPALAADWQPKILAQTYDPSIRPVWGKAGVTLGMAMTEKQGGSDVRANTTVAVPAGDHYRLTGHKWFCSAPMSDAFLTLAQAPGGLTCFLVPRWLEGRRNAIRLQRLKDKLGNHANASAEIEYHGAIAFPVGDEGEGVRRIIAMVHHTRLDSAMAPAGLMRAALTEAATWAAGRTAFQRRLIDQPLMRAVLADLALDWEAALALGLRVAEAFDMGEGPFARIAVALAKYLSNKRCPAVVAEAMECLGGVGYVNDTPMPMLYREAPLNAIWEGSGNVICLDILRTLAREPASAAALDDALNAASGEPRYDRALAAHRARWPGLPDEAEARWFAESLATLLAASVLIRRAPDTVAAAYVATRLDAPRGLTPGAAQLGDVGEILARIA